MRRSSTILLLKAKCRKTCLEKHPATFCLASPKYTLTDCVRYKPGNTSAVNFVVSFAVSKLDPARPSGQWSGLCTSDAADAKMPNSTVHLQYVSETFASLADALMVVKDGQNTLHFPVHTAIVSGYSPLLCDVLQQMDLPATAAARGSKAKLFMHGDSPAEVQAALDCIYKPFATENAGTRGVYLLTDSQQPHLIRFAHKYGMSTILAEVEAGLLAHFSTAWTNEQDDQRHPIRNDGVIRVAAAAEGCSQQKLLAYCELHIVLNFAHLEGQSLIAEQLSCQSLMRIAKGLAHCHKHDIRIMDTVLSRFSQEAEAAIISAKHSNASCPRGPCEGVLYSHTGDVYVTKYARCNKTQCRWPQTSGLRQKAEEAAFETWRAELLGLLTSWQAAGSAEQHV